MIDHSGVGIMNRGWHMNRVFLSIEKNGKFLFGF